MDAVRDLIASLLNPRARLERVPGLELSRDQEDPAHARRFRLRHILTNAPLLVGGTILLALFLVVLFGPIWAPTNPYLTGQNVTPHFDSVTGEWVTPPLSPSAEHPLGTDEWGHDLLSLLLYGARNTLVACAFITMVRVLAGLSLGAIAGWNEGGLSDQMVMAAIGVITSVPLLISSMILVLALDIRRGLPVFIVALSAVGWTEIAQYIRGEFLVLRRMPYIEGARALGSRGLGIAVRHVLPNLLPQLLVISFLEVAAVLTLLGELSFIGVFIGGGGQVLWGEEIAGIGVVELAEVPEWGAMLASGYRWLRSKPFIVFPPALAFFAAVIGFNSFGEGLRRLIEVYHVSTNFLLRRRMVLVVAAMTFATVFIINNTGPAPWFEKVARSFDADSAYRSMQALDSIEARSAGELGGMQAAVYVAERFEAYGLEPGWRRKEYLYPMESTLVRPREQPAFALLGPDGAAETVFQHQVDFAYSITGHGGSGQVDGPLTFVGFQKAFGERTWGSFRGLDLRDQIVLVVEGNAPADFSDEALIRGAVGVVWVTEDDVDSMRSETQLLETAGAFLQKPTLPIFRVRLPVAQTILESAGVTLADLFAQEDLADQSGPGWFARQLQARVRMSVDLSEPESVPTPAVLGFLPGTDAGLANQMVVLFAHYDALASEPDGTRYPAANDSAAGTSMLLEIARLWHEQDLSPRRSVLFVAWGAGQLPHPQVGEYLSDLSSFRHLPNPRVGSEMAPAVVVELDHVGGGGDGLLIHPASDPLLENAFERYAIQTGVPLLAAQGNEIYPPGIARVGGVDWLSFGWGHPAFPPAEDTLVRIEPEKLQAAGEVLVHFLTTMVREDRY